MTTVAIMQPYFVPYAGYFRLMACSDVFVVYDCVQFPRRGYVHRNRLLDAKEDPQWLTLPLAKAAFDVKLKDLSFHEGANEEFTKRCHTFPALQDTNSRANDWFTKFGPLTGTPAQFIERTLKEISQFLGFSASFISSSTLSISPEAKGQERILSILRTLGAHRYINSPGGRDLYHSSDFERAGIQLQFLPSYKGNMLSILQRLCTESIDEIKTELLNNMKLEP